MYIWHNKPPANLNSDFIIVVNIYKINKNIPANLKLYFRLAFVSNKTIRWEGKIHTELYVEGRVRKFMWRGNPCTMKLIHIEE